MDLDTTIDEALNAKPDPALQRAYGALLGNDYERNFMEQVQLTALTKTLATDLETAMTWAISSVEQSAVTMPPLSFAPMLLTDVASAMFGNHSWFKMQPGVSERIDSFVKTLKPHWIVVAYGSGSDKRRESFLLYGTDGFTWREVHILAERKMFGGTTVQRLSDETSAPWEHDGFLSNVSRTLREQSRTRLRLVQGVPTFRVSSRVAM